jgi:hypothetical protein
MRSLTIALAIMASIGFAASFAPSAQSAAGGNLGKLSLPAPTSPVQPAACGGRPGPHCPPGSHWVCGPYGHRCWCAPC